VLAEIERQIADAGWRERLICNKDGRVTATIHNVATILEHDDRLAGLLRLNEFATKVVFSREPPFGGGLREISDAEVAELAAWFGHPETYGLNVATGLMYEAVGMVAARNKFHPVRDYLDALHWDGEDRLPRLLADYFGVEYDEYSRQVGLNFMIAAAARVRDPGCKSDLMMILEGAQGAGKSTAIELLSGSDWFVATTESPDNKDFYQILQGRWLVEIEEMQAFSKPQMPKVKSAVSAKVDVFRPSYGRMPRSFPRHCIFVGTTNDDEYLRDPTGARRFMPVRVSGVELEMLKADRDQLWAEADARYKRGECYWELPAQAEHERARRYMEDSWADPISDWLEGYGHYDSDGPAAFSGRKDEVTIDQVLSLALNLDKSRHTRQEQMRAGSIIKRMGWVRRQRRVNGRKRWLYLRPEEDRNDHVREQTEAVNAF
jgi:putative DNA primase/helicase